MFRRALITAALAALTTLAAPGWVPLGEAHVDGSLDHDNIKVGEDRGPFRAIRLQVQYGAIQFHRVQVHFGDGSSAPVRVAALIRAGRQTRMIPFRGGPRKIRSVEFWYARGNGRNPQRPQVILLGLQ